MLDRKFVAENAEAVKAAARAKNEKHADVDAIVALNGDRRGRQGTLDELRRRLNEASQEVARRKKAGQDAADLIAANRDISTQVAAAESALRDVDAKIDDLLQWLPNLPAADAPVGDTTANQIVRAHGTPAEIPNAKAHWDLGFADFERAGALAGSNFALFVGPGARLVRALINFMLDRHTQKHGYTEVWPPVISRPDNMFGSAQLPKMKDDMYYLERDDVYLVPTAEVPLTNLHRGEILPGESLPRKYTAYTPCFRREAGAYGSDTRGLLRIHQFDKVELVQYVHPDRGDAAHEEMLGHAESILRDLGLTYRVVKLATGDMSFASARTYDLEAWAPGVKRWLEVSSVSTCTDFQARRMNLRFRDADKKVRFPHMLNGSGVALPRTIIALVETHQQPDGSVVIPEALRPAMGTDRIKAVQPSRG